MIKRVFALFLIGICMMNVSLLHAQERGDIDLRMEDPRESQTGGRSIDVAPSAYIESAFVTIDFPMFAESQVVIRDAESGTVVYSAPYDATLQVVVNLSSLPEGLYELHLYAFGKWWWKELLLKISQFPSLEKTSKI